MTNVNQQLLGPLESPSTISPQMSKMMCTGDRDLASSSSVSAEATTTSLGPTTSCSYVDLHDDLARLDASSLLCNEELDVSDLSRTPKNEVDPHDLYHQHRHPHYREDLMNSGNECDGLHHHRPGAGAGTGGGGEPQVHLMVPTAVQAASDECQLGDDRILQNLLKNEHRSSLDADDYMKTVQAELTPYMRKLVADWMLGVVQEQDSQPDVFCMAMSLLDRFLCRCRIKKSQLQLLGSVCILISSKIREPLPISGNVIISFTDYSITSEEVKEWELLVLYKLEWELTCITALDYLDHVLPRLGLNESVVDVMDLRLRIVTILVLVNLEYEFAYHSPSLMAAAAIVTAIKSLSQLFDSHPASSHSILLHHPHDAVTCQALLREVKLRVQTLTHTVMAHIDRCVDAFEDVLPHHLTSKRLHHPHRQQQQQQHLPDSTGSPPQQSPGPDQKTANESLLVPSSPESSSAAGGGGGPRGPEQLLLLADEEASRDLSGCSSSIDLTCTETLGNESSLLGGKSPQSTVAAVTAAAAATGEAASRSSSPLSAVDIFTEYNTNVLQAIFKEAEERTSSSTILVS